MSYYSTVFPEADEDPLSQSSKWDGGYTGQDNMAIVSHRLRISATAPNGTSMMTYNGQSFSGAQEGIAIVGASLGASSTQISVLLYANAPAGGITCYRICSRRNDASAKTRIQKIVGGTVTNLTLENSSNDWTAGDALRAAIYNDGAGNNTLLVYKNEVLVIGPFTDNAIASGARIGAGIVPSTVPADGEISGFVGSEYTPRDAVTIGRFPMPLLSQPITAGRITA